jgi:hypothetical protein
MEHVLIEMIDIGEYDFQDLLKVYKSPKWNNFVSKQAFLRMRDDILRDMIDQFDEIQFSLMHFIIQDIRHNTVGMLVNGELPNHFSEQTLDLLHRFKFDPTLYKTILKVLDQSNIFFPELAPFDPEQRKMISIMIRTSSPQRGGTSF